MRSLWWTLLGVAVCSTAWAQSFSRCNAPDGAGEAYYAAGDEYLVAAFDLMDAYWSRIAKEGLSQVRGHLDNYLPLELQTMHHVPADAIMRKFAEAFFAARNPETGLIPGTAWTWNVNHLVLQKNKQPVYLIAKAANLLEWFPDDPGLRAQSVSLAEATMKAFDFEYTPGRKAGMWGYVDAAGGEAKGPITITLHYGAMAWGMAYLSKLTDDPRFLQWADQKLEFVWKTRLNKDLPILCDTFVPYSAVMNDGWTSDTDTLYHVRYLFKIHALNGSEKYRNWALAVTDLWFERAWHAEWGHFIRKLHPDGSPAVRSLYGDAKYNTLHILIAAYRVTKDPKYLERLEVAWRNLLRMNCDGLVAESITAGKPDASRGFDPQQTIFVEILLDAYEATGDPEWLRQAEAHAAHVLEAGKKAMRLEGCQAGRAFLRLALARRPVGRLECPAAAQDTVLKITKDGKTQLETRITTDRAVVYLPAGTYRVESAGTVRDVTLEAAPSAPLREKRS